MQNAECRIKILTRRCRGTVAGCSSPVTSFALLLFFFQLAFGPAIEAQDKTPAENALARLGSGLNRFVLDNGLVLLTREDQSAPVVSIQVWVGAGAIHEQEFLGGGLSHLLEHMVFKGTPERKPGEISRAIADLGGSINAYTSLDRTVFLVDLPAAHWQKGLTILADAVLNASFPDDEWQREKEVVRREMAMDKDNPDRRLSELLWQTAYRVHPYRVPIIGYEDIFQTLTRAELLTFFRRHYLPNNMIVAIVGNVRGAEVRSEVQRQFAKRARGAYPGVVLPTEPEQIGERTARQSGAWTVARAAWAWHTVELSHPDAPGLDLLAAIVGQGDSSRLVRELRENKKLVSRIEAWSFTPRHPGLFGLEAVFDPTNEPVLARALEDEITRWTTQPFSLSELEKARRQVLTGTLGAFETMHGQAEQFASGEFYAGTPLFFQVYLRRLKAVTPESLSGVARRYLRPDNLTRVALMPDMSTWSVERQASSGGQVNGDQKSEHAPRSTLNTQRSSEGEVQKTVLPGGLILLARADHKLPFVDFCVVCRGGLLLEHENNNGISALMTEMLTRGTRRRSAQDIATLVESRGGSLTTFAGQNSFGLRARCLKEDAEDFMELLADCLLNPAFAAEEVEKQKAIQLSAIKQQRERPMFLAQEALRQVLFAGHPYRFSPEGTAETVQGLSPAALRDYHARTVLSSNTVLAIFGDLTAEDCRSMVERFLDQFPAGGPPQRARHGAAQPNLPQQVSRTVPKEQTIVLAGFPGIELKDPRRAALEVLQEALNGLSSELMLRIRDEKGLAYYTGAWQRPGLEPGFFALFAGTRAGKEKEVLELMQQEIQRVTSGGLSAEEFERARAQLIADHQQSLQLNGATALECALNELYGLGYGYSFALPERLAELTSEDVRKAAAGLLGPEKCVNVVVQP